MTRYARGFKGSMRPAAGPRATPPASGPGSAQQPFTGPTRPAGSPSGKPMANDSFIRAIAAGPQPNPLSGAKMGGISMKKGGSVGSASKRADGIATKGKTKGKIC